jgi:hypothetical protein
MNMPGINSSSSRGYESSLADRPLTIREGIDRTIEQHNRDIARLVMLRDSTPDALLDMPQQSLAALVYPSNPFV